MRRKVVIGLAAYFVVFLLASGFLIRSIRVTTENLNRLLTLHQVEILREHYLLQIRKVQSDLTSKHTRYSIRYDKVVSNVVNMGKIIDTCFSCHHKPHAEARLHELKQHTGEYKVALSRVLTVAGSERRVVDVEDAAFLIGEHLIQRVQEMIALTTTRLQETTQKALDEVVRTKYILYGLVALGPLVSTALGVLFLLGLTRPVNVLVESTRKLKAGDLDHRVAGLKDEFAELGNSFNDMASSLKEQVQKMRRTEQMVVVGELAAGLAHEIKNPMAGIKVAMSVLSGEPYISAEDKEVLRKVVEEIARMEGLMKNFLNFAKPQNPRLETVNVNQVLNTTLAFQMKHQAAGADGPAKVEIVREFGDLPPTQADSTQLQQVFLNLFLNAFHAMPRGGELRVRTSLEVDGATIRIEVSDTGSGIREDLLDKVFEPFFTTRAKGTGLGLALSRQVIERHGGTITVANRPGGGALFTLRLPVRAEPEPTPGAAA